MAVVLLITTCAVVFSGNVTQICNAAEIRSGVSTQVDSRTEEKTGTEPCKKEDGGKFRIAFVDYDEYMPASRQFYYILSDLEEKGWIRKGSLPFTIEDIDTSHMSTKDMYEALEKEDLGEYIEFAEDGFAFLAYDDRKAVAEKYKTRAGKDIDLVLTFGTAGGLFVKELNLPVPMVDFSATDPVASGIIASSTEGSGNPNVWAQVEPSLPLRQLKYYYSICPFRRLGVIVYGDETISGVPDIIASAEETKFQLVKYNIEQQPRGTKEELDRYYRLVEDRIRQMADQEDIDAFFLPVDLINDPDRLEHLLDPLYQKNIPVYLMDDVEAVKKGGLLLIQANDRENVGRFVADTIGLILNGAEAGSLPCVYTSSPSIYLNYDVGRRIHYPMKFEFLAACYKIFTRESQNEKE